MTLGIMARDGGTSWASPGPGRRGPAGPGVIMMERVTVPVVRVNLNLAEPVFKL